LRGEANETLQRDEVPRSPRKQGSIATFATPRARTEQLREALLPEQS
jgi:hypothetical protein